MPKAAAKEPTKWTVIDVTGMPKSAKENKILKKFEEVSALDFDKISLEYLVINFDEGCTSIVNYSNIEPCA